MKKYNLSKIMKRAWELVKKVGMTISSGLKKAWKEAKEMKENALTVIETYESFNHRRYSNPWVAIVSKETGRLDFSKRIGGYTGGYNQGEAGELYISKPEDGAVYAYGQKDYRGRNGGYQYIKYTGGEFIPVEKSNLIKALNN